MAAVVGLAFLCALNYSVFVFPNQFAPAGVDGVCTMIQDVLHINMGYLALLVNLPLMVAAFVVLNRDFAIKSAVFVLFFSVSAVLLEKIDISRFYFATENGTSTVLAPLAAGTFRGLLYAATLNLNGSAGGIDIISALIKHKKPHLELMNIIFGINMLIAGASYFVYGRSFEPVICSIMYAFVTSTVCNKLRGAKTRTVKFEIITKEPEALCSGLVNDLHLKATVVDACGASGSRLRMVLCVVKKEKAPFVEELILAHPGCAVFKSEVSDAVLGVTYK